MMRAMTPAEIDDALETVRRATARLLSLVGDPPADARRPTTLPGWSVGHLLTHLARNADGTRRLLDGAARGEVVDQYPHGREGRDADIEAGSGRPAAEIVEDVTGSSAALDQRWETLPAEAWSRPVRTFAGESPAWDTLVVRNREIEIHSVDLGCGYRAVDWPASFVDAELLRLAGGLAGRLPPGTALQVATTDTGWSADVEGGPALGSSPGAGQPGLEAGPGERGHGSTRSMVSGRSPFVLAWLLGRAVPAGELTTVGRLPRLAAG